MTEIESQQLATFVSGAWPQNKMTEMTCSIYAAKFEPLDFAATKAAILRLMDTNEFRPSFAEIRKTANRERNTGNVGALKVHESLALPEGKKREATPNPEVAEFITKLTKDKRTDEARRRKEKSGERQ